METVIYVFRLDQMSRNAPSPEWGQSFLLARVSMKLNVFKRISRALLAVSQ